ncbi:serine hydrolase [Lysobacter antibioticus]|uniref:serine hydrolase n=1 Tax=Lysobacter antibioticus TaxID=84531 RepID=UPI000347C069|nr:serine hydrolase [Lysobacter antibioticus]
MRRLRLPRAVLLFIGLLAAPAFAASTSAAGDGATAAELDRIVDGIRARYRLPGVAVAVVEDGRASYRRTAGVLALGEGAAVGPGSLFKIASNTKAMTAAALARLVDAGKLRWDDPVARYLPQFRMSEDWVTREFQVRDLLIHNSGLRAGAGDLMLWPEPNAYTRADILHGLRYLRPQHSFRSRYAYDNLLYIVAGEVAAVAAGAPYEVALQREVFEPLGMRGCRVGSWTPGAGDELAQPHARRGDRYVVVRRDGAAIPASTMDPAGGVRCGLDDMVRWLQAWLDPERRGADGKPWLSAEQRRAVWAAQMPMPVSARQRDWSRSRFSAYGYGWRLGDVHGEFKVSHTGTLMGMYSLVAMLPDRRAGYVVLINGDAGDARSVFDQVLSERYAPPPQPRDWTQYAAEIAREEAAPASRRAPDTSARTAARRAALAPWLGRYRDPWFGEASVCAQGDTVRFVAGKSPLLSGKIQQVGGRWLVDWDADEVDVEAWLDFARAPDGGITLGMSKVDPDADFSYDYEDLAFARIGDCG